MQQHLCNSMEDHSFLCGVSSDASQLHADVNFQGPCASPLPASPPPPCSPLHSQHDFRQPFISSLPLSYTKHDSLHPLQCAQESCATTDSIIPHDEHKSHAHKSDDTIPIHHSFEAVELDLSLASGGYHQELHGLWARVTSEAAEHSTSSILTELDRSTNGLAAAELSQGASCLALKSSVGAPWENQSASSVGVPWENQSASSFNHGLLASTKHCQNVGDFEELSPSAKGHPLFQVRVDRSGAFPFVTGALPADGAFVASPQEKVFFCKFCDRRFHSSQALGGHQNAHKRERLVARSSPAVRFGATAVFCAVPGSMPFQLPSCSMQQRLVDASEDGPLPSHPLIGGMCRGRSLLSLPRLQAPSVCTDGFGAPPSVSAVSSSKLQHDCLPSRNVYMENRSLGIKAHSLVHKPSLGHSFPPRMGHLKAVNVISSPGRASTTHHGWCRASMDPQPWVASRCFVPGQDHLHVQRNMHHGARFFLHMMKDGSAGFLHPEHRQYTAGYTEPLASHSDSLSTSAKSGFLYEVDSSSTVVDLALHL